MSIIVEKIKAELQAFEEKKIALIAELKNEFPLMFKELFQYSNRVKSIGWRQYTPYFNDGDSCTFSAHMSDLIINGRDPDYDDDNDDSDKLEWLRLEVRKELFTQEDIRINKELATKLGYTWYASKGAGEEGFAYNPNYDESEANLVNQFKEILTSIPESFLEDIFGDHVTVTINSDGSIDIEDYEHD